MVDSSTYLEPGDGRQRFDDLAAVKQTVGAVPDGDALAGAQVDVQAVDLAERQAHVRRRLRQRGETVDELARVLRDAEERRARQLTQRVVRRPRVNQQLQTHTPRALNVHTRMRQSTATRYKLCIRRQSLTARGTQSVSLPERSG